MIKPTRFSLDDYQISVNTAIAYAIAIRFLMYVTIPVLAAAIALRVNLPSKRTALNSKASSAQLDSQR